MPAIQTQDLIQALDPPSSLLGLPTSYSALPDASDRSMSVFLFLLLHGQWPVYYMHIIVRTLLYFLLFTHHKVLDPDKQAPGM